MLKNILPFVFLLLMTSCQQPKQNFVFILVDDLGWNDVGYAGSSFYETPNIDALSKNSVQFTDAYASASICSPTRASIMTGKHPAHVNITDWIPGLDPKNRPLIGAKDLDALPLDEVTMAEVFKQNGYNTFFAGKWHLGDEGFLPEDQGFDINLGGNHKGHPRSYYSPYRNPNLKDGTKGEYLTDRLTDECISFIKDKHDKPFFLYLPYYTVHTPIQASKRHVEKFRRKLAGMKNEQDLQKEEGEGMTRLNQQNPEYASMVYAMDENVGRLIDALKEAGLYENTTLVFTSDNGGLSTLDKKYKRMAPTSIAPLRAGKGWLYEGGIRVPLLIKPAKENKALVVDEPVVSHDFYPTFLAMSGIDMPKDVKVDGVDISGLWNGEELEREELFWHYPHYHGSAWKPGAAIRQGDWKLLEFYETDHCELYNLANDLSEQNDLASKYPEKVLQLKDRLHQLQDDINANKVMVNMDFKKGE